MLKYQDAVPIERGVTHRRSEADTLIISVADVQAHLRVDTDDSYIEGLIRVAQDYAARYLSRSLVETEWTRQYDLSERRPQLSREYAERQYIVLPYPPVTSIDRVYTTDRDGDETDLTDYTEDLFSEPARVLLHQFVVGRDLAMLRVDYTAGYTNVPHSIQHGLKMHTGYLYEHRGDCDVQTAAKSSGAQGLYDGYRVVLH